VFKSGFVNIIGLPNAGKSSIINRLLDDKFSIVTSKAQTTRHRAHAIINGEDFQVVISDTPGFTIPKNKIHEYMNKKILSSFKDADIILFIVELGAENRRDNQLIEKIKKIKIPVLLVLNKVDKVNQDILEEESNFWSNEIENIETWVVSAKENFNIQNLKNRVIELLPEGPKYYPDDVWTDKNERFFVNEIIREKIFNIYSQEIPYISEVITESFKIRNKVLRISSMIIVERDSQKGIIIGNNGESIKKLGSESRKDLEDFFSKKVFLELNVKVYKDWRKNSNHLKKLGYN
jgi:GTP-binding protein Era|tara:strand:- start:512 stop:1387 length:876 start_codon:yes stop_codon:yes gene_type:complete